MDKLFLPLFGQALIREITEGLVVSINTQQQTTEEITSNIIEIKTTSTNTVEGIVSVTNSNEDLSTIASSLQDMVDQYRVLH